MDYKSIYLDCIKRSTPVHPLNVGYKSVKTPISSTAMSFEKLLHGRISSQPKAMHKNSSFHPPRYYQVKSGDTLWEIVSRVLESRGESVSNASISKAVHQVAQANGLKDANLIRVGYKLDLSSLETEIPSQTASSKTMFPHKPGQGSVPNTLSAATPAERTTSANKAPGLTTVAEKTHSAPVSPHRQETGKDITAFIQKLLKPGEMTGSSISYASSRKVSWSRLLGGYPARLTSGFGIRKDPFTGRPQFHTGIDIAAPTGTPIYPLKTGRVIFTGWKGGYGKMVIIRHVDGSETRYGHASKLLVKKGQFVTSSMPIAQVGSTGRSTGPHLHFEYRKDGHPLDPMRIVTAESREQLASLR